MLHLQVASRKKSSRTQTLQLLLAYLLLLRQPLASSGNKPCSVHAKPLSCLMGTVVPAIIEQVRAETIGLNCVATFRSARHDDALSVIR